MLETTFDDAKLFLTGFRIPSFEQAAHKLIGLCNILNLVEIARDLGLDQRPELKTLACVFDVNYYAEKLIDLVSELLPVDEILTLQEVLDGEEPRLWIQPCGMNSLTFEQADELLMEPDPFDYEKSLRVFVHFFSTAVDSEFWETANEGFGWGMDYPTEIMNEVCVDYDLLETLLKEREMKPFIGSFKIAGGMTQNPFLTLNYELSELVGETEGFDFDAATIRNLQKQWPEVVAAWDDHRAAAKLVGEDPSYYGRLLDVYRAALPARVRVKA